MGSSVGRRLAAGPIARLDILALWRLKMLRRIANHNKGERNHEEHDKADTICVTKKNVTASGFGIGFGCNQQLEVAVVVPVPEKGGRIATGPKHGLHAVDKNVYGEAQDKKGRPGSPNVNILHWLRLHHHLTKTR